MPDNDSLDALESRLQALRPAAPPPRIAAAIARRVDATPRHDALSWFPTQLVAAACVALLAGLAVILAEHNPVGNEPPAPRPVRPGFAVGASPTALYRPVASTQYVYEAIEEGLVEGSDGTPLRRVRARSWETVSYKGPTGDLEVRVPREDILFIPLPSY